MQKTPPNHLEIEYSPDMEDGQIWFVDKIPGTEGSNAMTRQKTTPDALITRNNGMMTRRTPNKGLFQKCIITLIPAHPHTKGI